MDMKNNNRRPKYLNLLKIRLPIGGVVSILHRLTGVMLVLLLPLAIYLLQRSLQSPVDFVDITAWFSRNPGRLLWLLIVWVFAQHFFSGLRHLLLDIDIGVEKSRARAGAWITFAASGVTVLVLGICL